MDLGSIFLLLALALLVVVFVSRPFMNRKLAGVRLAVSRASHGAVEKEIRHSSLLAERERLLSALQELEFDYALGKIPAGEYPEQRKYLLLAGAEVLKELDELEGAVSNTPQESGEKRMEDEAARISLAGSKTPAGAGEEDELELLIAARRKQRTGKSAGFCPKCGKPVQAADEFCPKCGKKL